jgi:hypothetical protein
MEQVIGLHVMYVTTVTEFKIKEELEFFDNYYFFFILFYVM